MKHGLLRTAAALVLLVLGVAAGVMMSGSNAHRRKGEMHLLLVYEPAGFQESLSPTDIARIDQEYELWWDELLENDTLIGWIHVSPDGAQTIQGGFEDGELLGKFIPLPQPAGEEVLGWVVVVQAESTEEATTIARGCPALADGARVEIRPGSQKLQQVGDGPAPGPA